MFRPRLLVLYSMKKETSGLIGLIVLSSGLFMLFGSWVVIMYDIANGFSSISIVLFYLMVASVVVIPAGYGLFELSTP